MNKSNNDYSCKFTIDFMFVLKCGSGQGIYKIEQKKNKLTKNFLIIETFPLFYSIPTVLT